MLMNLHKKPWTRGLGVRLPTAPPSPAAPAASNEELLASLATMSEAYAARVAEEEGASKEQLAVMGVGKVDPKKRLEADVAALLASNLVGNVSSGLSTLVM
jgi:26S proteasome regulatory subunit N11